MKDDIHDNDIMIVHEIDFTENPINVHEFVFTDKPIDYDEDTTNQNESQILLQISLLFSSLANLVCVFIHLFCVLR